MSPKRQAKASDHRRTGMPRRRRVTQETIDEMAALRRQGLTFAEIGTRVGCNERTARRYVGRVQPQLHLPQKTPELDTDPRTLRERLLSEFMLTLYRDHQLRRWTLTWVRIDESTQRAVYGGPPSILFLSEAERLLREQLEKLGLHAVRFLALDPRSKVRFIREVVGPLYNDYAGWHQFSQNFGETGEGWRPKRERPPSAAADEDFL